MTSIKRLLVANRGEIARRVMRSCRDLGIETVAVHSDPDAELPFVREADLAVRLPGAAPSETYLRADLVIDAAIRAGADAVHPGYGFLSESADFAAAVQEASLTWVGPSPASMAQMATKREAKELMASAGVPVLAELAPESVTGPDLPVLVKASAGGGGRGMRVVRSLGDLDDAVEQASAEAASAFGDATVFVEPYVERGRHVEVQVLGDTHGTVLVLGERDCSVQRRHQKVVEETPAPGLPDDLRRALHEAARAAARAIGYVGAGTVEFLVSTDPQTGAPDRFFFLEMNTRLQVEHPVTECVTGLDLVAMQIAVAEGARLPADVPGSVGHAIEARLYAEDPAHDWRPQSGRLSRFDVPGVTGRFAVPAAFGLRLDAGFEPGDSVGTHYDAMLAKLVSWAPTRAEAARRLATALRSATVHGVRTNRDLLVGVLTDSAFLAGEVHTEFLSEQAQVPPRTPADCALEAFAAAVASAERARRGRPVLQGVVAGWRNVVSAPQVTAFETAGLEVRVGWLATGDGYRLVQVGDEPTDARARSVDPTPTGFRVVVEQAGVSRSLEVSLTGRRVDVDGPRGHVALTRVPRFADPAEHVAEGSLLAPMPGSVVTVHASAGSRVAGGEPMLVLEAMKMQHTIAAPYDGVVADLVVSAGDQVAAGQVLVVVHRVTDDEHQKV